MKFDNPAWRAAPLRTGLKVAASLVRRRSARLSRAIVRYDDGRSSICADLRTPLGLGLYRYGHRDEDIALVAQLLGRNDVFIDGGANIGLFTLVAAERVGPEGKVIAFEPARAVRLCLLENVVLNRFSQVEVLPFALSSSAGQASFRAFEPGSAGLNHLCPIAGEEGQVETVALTTLDVVLLPSDRARLKLIKLDLEGAEHAALLGASQTLAELRPDLLIEVEPAHLLRMGTSADALKGLLQSYGYAFYGISSNASGRPLLVSNGNGSRAGSTPNLFATVSIDRARGLGVAVL
jgi:FkbM family methyltransferase